MVLLDLKDKYQLYGHFWDSIHPYTIKCIKLSNCVWDQKKICMKLNYTAEDLRSYKIPKKLYWIITFPKISSQFKVLMWKSFLLWNLWGSFICYIVCNIGHLFRYLQYQTFSIDNRNLKWNNFPFPRQYLTCTNSSCIISLKSKAENKMQSGDTLLKLGFRVHLSCLLSLYKYL